MKFEDVFRGVMSLPAGVNAGRSKNFDQWGRQKCTAYGEVGLNVGGGM